MTEYTAKDRMAEGHTYLQKYKIEMQVFGGLTFIVIMIILGPSFLSDSEGYGTNVYTELASVLATIFVIDRLNERRLNKQKEEELIDNLVRRVGSPVNEVALAALDEIRKRDLPLGEDGILKGKNLAGANLENANLQGVNLSGSILTSANLSGVKGHSAKFTNASISGAMLQNAELYKADFSNAYMLFVDFSDAILQYADFTKAKLWQSRWLHARAEHCDFTDANLDSVNLQQASLWCSNLTNTVLESADLCAAELLGVNLSQANLNRAIFNIRTNFAGVYVNDEPIPFIFPDGEETMQWSPDHHIRLSLEFGMSIVNTTQ